MADIESNIKINVDTTTAIEAIKNLQRQISKFQSDLARGDASANNTAAKQQQRLINEINATKKFDASFAKIKSTTESFTDSLEKNKLSIGEYFKFAGGASKTFGKAFSREFETIQQVAIERVKDLQTQFIALGRDANGVLKSIKVRPLTLDMKDLGVQTQVAAQRAQLFHQLIEQGSTSMLNWGKNTQWAGRQLMVGFTIPLVMMGTTASKTFMQIEEQVIKLRRVYGDFATSVEDTNKMVSSIRNLASEFTKWGVAVQDTMQLAADAAAAGKMGADLIDQVTEATRLAVLGQVDQQQALQTTMSLTNAFGTSTDKLAGKIDFLNAVENQTVTSIDDLTEAIPKAGPVIQQLGGDVEDLAYLLTAMREGGINAAEGANALKSGLASMINPTKKASDFLKGFGINIKGIVESNKGDVKSTVEQFAMALDKLDPLNRARAIEQLFGKFQFARMSTLFQNVIKEGSQAQRVMELTKSSAAEMAIVSERELKKVESSTTYRFKKASEDFQSAIAPIGEEFLKAITPFIKMGTDLLKWFNSWDSGAKQFAARLTLIAAGVGPVLIMTLGLLANGIAQLIKGMNWLGKIFSDTGKSSGDVAQQLDYMTQSQIDSAAVAASLEQAHSKLIQTFGIEGSALEALNKIYDEAIARQERYQGKTSSHVGNTATQKYANGVVSVPGPKGAGDIVPALLSPGEAVIPAKMTNKYKPLIHGMISGNLPGYNNGGIIGEEKYRVPAGLFSIQDVMDNLDLINILPNAEDNPFSGIMGSIYSRIGTPSSARFTKQLQSWLLSEILPKSEIFRQQQSEDIPSIIRDNQIKGKFESGQAGMGGYSGLDAQRKFMSEVVFGKDSGVTPGSETFGYLKAPNLDFDLTELEPMFQQIAVERNRQLLESGDNRQVSIDTIRESFRKKLQSTSKGLISPSISGYGDVLLRFNKQKMIGTGTRVVVGDTLSSQEASKVRSMSLDEILAGKITPEQFLEGIVPGGYSDFDTTWEVAIPPAGAKAENIDYAALKQFGIHSQEGVPITDASVQKALEIAKQKNPRLKSPMSMLSLFPETVGNTRGVHGGWGSYGGKPAEKFLMNSFTPTDPAQLRAAQAALASIGISLNGIENYDPVVLEKLTSLATKQREAIDLGIIPPIEGFQRLNGDFLRLADGGIIDKAKGALAQYVNYPLMLHNSMGDRSRPLIDEMIKSQGHFIPKGTKISRVANMEDWKMLEQLNVGDTRILDRFMSVTDSSDTSFIERMISGEANTGGRGKGGAPLINFDLISDVPGIYDINSLFDQPLSNVVDGLLARGSSFRVKNISEGPSGNKVYDIEIGQGINATEGFVNKHVNDRGLAIHQGAIEELLSEGKPIPYYLQEPYTPIGMEDFPRYANGGIITSNAKIDSKYHFADGVISVPGPKGAGDVVPAMLSPGEAVIPAKHADKYSDLINGMVAGNLPGYAEGRTTDRRRRTGSAVMQDVDTMGLRDVVEQLTSDLSENMTIGVARHLTESKPDLTTEEFQKVIDQTRITLSQMEEVGTENVKVFKNLVRYGTDYVRYYQETGKKALDTSYLRANNNPEIVEITKKAVPNFMGDLKPEFAHMTEGLSMTAEDFVKNFKVIFDGLPEHIQEMILKSVEDGGNISLMGGLGMDILGRTNKQLAQVGGAGIGQFVTDFNAAGAGKWSRSIGIGGGDPSALQDSANNLDAIFLRLLEESGANAVVDSKDQIEAAKAAGKNAVAATDLMSAAITELAQSANEHDKALASILLKSAATFTEPRVDGMSADTRRTAGGYKIPEADIAMLGVAAEQFGTEVIKAMLDGINKALEIASPSKVAKKTGEDVADGFVEGIESKKPEATKAGEDIAQEVIRPDLTDSLIEEANAANELVDMGVSPTDAVNNPQAQLEAMKANEKDFKNRKRQATAYKVARTVGMVGTGLSMAASFLPGQLGEAAQKATPAITAATTAMQMIPGPWGIVAAGLAASVAIFTQVQDALNKTRDEAAKLASTLGTGADAIEKYAVFAGRATSSEIMRKQREELSQGINVKAGKAKFGATFMQSEEGAAMIKDIQAGISKFGKTAIMKKLGSQLTTAIISGALNKDQANSIAYALGKQLNDMSISIGIIGKMQAILGPDGKSFKDNPIKVAGEVTGDALKQVQGINEEINSIKKKGNVFDGFSLAALEGRQASALVDLVSVQQQMLDSLDLEYQKRIANLAAEKKFAEALSLSVELENKKRGLLASNQTQLESALGVDFNKLETISQKIYTRADVNSRGFATSTGKTDSATAIDPAAQKEITAMVTTKFAGTDQEKRVTDLLTRLDEQDSKGVFSAVMQLGLASGNIDPAVLDMFTQLDFGKDQQKMLGIVTQVSGEMGSAAGQQLMKLVNTIPPGKDAAQIRFNVSSTIQGAMLEDPIKGQKVMDMFTTLANYAATYGDVIDVNAILRFYSDEANADKLQEQMDDIAKLKELESQGKLNIKSISKFITDEEGFAALKQDSEYFNSLDPVNKVLYVQTLRTVYETLGTPEGQQDIAAWKQANNLQGISNEEARNQMAAEAARSATEAANAMNNLSDSTNDAKDSLGGLGNQFDELTAKIDMFRKALAVIELKEKAINEKYDKRAKALERIADINKDIAQQQSNQLDLADALSRGDIAAAARAVQKYRSDQAAVALEQQKKELEDARQRELKAVTFAGYSREDLENKLKNLEMKLAKRDYKEAKKYLETKGASANTGGGSGSGSGSGKKDGKKEDPNKGKKGYHLYGGEYVRRKDLKDPAEGYEWVVDGDKWITKKIPKDTKNPANAPAGTSVWGPFGKTVNAARSSQAQAQFSTANLFRNSGPAGGNKKVDAGKDVAAIAAERENEKAKIDNSIEAMKKHSEELGNNGGKAILVADHYTNLSGKVSDAGASAKIAQDKIAEMSRQGGLLGGTMKKIGNHFSTAKTEADNLKASLKDFSAKSAVSSLLNLRVAAGDITASQKASIMGQLGYAKGGLINMSRFAAGGYALGTDTVPAMLTPGEFVISRPAVQNFGVDNLKAINSGGTPDSGSVYNYSVTVNASTSSDADQIAETVMKKIQAVNSRNIGGNRI